MRRLHYCVVASIATLILPLAGRAQVLTPSRVRVDTLTRLPQPTPLAILPPGNAMRVCLDCHGWRELRPGMEPAFIIKDSAAHVLAMIPPGDSAYRRDPWPRLLEPGMIAGVEVLHDTSLVRVLGRGFENGLLIITLTPAGTATWQSAVAREATPP
jgi:hypothetical protein